MSTVYLAQELGAPDTHVAVKVLNTSQPDGVQRALYERETQALKRLAHPNVVQLKGADWSPDMGAFYLILDYIPFALDRFLRGEDQLPRPPDPHRVIRELAAALGHAHSAGVVHRDVKPSNIMLDANGRAMLMDFGISKLLDQLTVGETLARFFSSGYASPEQRSAAATDYRSDVYSLGAVYYRLLSGREPPPEGPTSELVDDHVRAANPLRQTLKQMLATTPDDRPKSGVGLLSSLNVTYRYEQLPQHFLIVTNNAVQDLLSSDYHPAKDFESVADVLHQDLGGMAHAEVHAHMDPRSPTDLVILGDSLRLVCAADPSDGALVVKAVHEPYMPKFDLEKAAAMPVRAIWTPFRGSLRGHYGSDILSRASRDLAHLLSSLEAHRTSGTATQQQRDSRRYFIERWRQALAEHRRRIEGDGPMLQYSTVERQGGRLRFGLTQDPPDNLWEQDTPLVASGPDGRSFTPVGNLVDVRGHVLEVADVRRAPNSTLPPAGTLTANAIEALAENQRQQQAVNNFLAGQIANPHLATAIMDPSRATRGPAPSLEYFQQWLSPDKKQAVANALSCNELFLVHGPPGTGKTALIAELVLQILKKTPRARILLSSQSNVAVDHALTRIASTAEDAQARAPTMVRIGRPDKIRHGGQRWTLAARAEALRREIIQRSRPTIEKLKRDERRIRAAAKAAGELADSEIEEAGDFGEWILEAEDLVRQLEDYEQEEASIGPDASSSTRERAKALVEDARTNATQHISAVGNLLSCPVQVEGLSPREALSLIAAAAVPSRRGQQGGGQASKSLTRIQHLRKVLSQWTRVAGRGADFEDLVGQSSSLVAATCSISGRLGRTSEPTAGFDWAIIDEAGRATVPEVLVPIVNAQRVVLVGDERQLPPMVENEVAAARQGNEAPLDESLFQALVEQLRGESTRHLARLRSQYRMHPDIGALVSDVFYDSELETGKAQPHPDSAYDWLPGRVIWISTSEDGNRRESRRGHSYFNVIEAELVGQLLQKFERASSRRARPVAVGVIASYAGQVERIRSTIDPADHNRWAALDIEVATVDSFQGRERDIVIYSTVRSNPEGKIGFQSDFRRVNVALSRAREVLIVVGDVAMMENARVGLLDNPFTSVIEHMRALGSHLLLPAQDLRLL